MWRETPVRRAPAEPAVRAMFDGIVDRYDLLNRVISLGLDRGWRREAVADLAPLLAREAPILDLGCGTGEFGHLLGCTGHLVGLDLSGRMLGRARARLGPAARLVQGSAFHLPFAEASLAGVVSGFVLRNLDDLPAALTELARVLRPRAPIVLLDAIEPTNPLWRWLFDLYFGSVAPAAGALVGRRRAYAYLARSLVQVPPEPELAQHLSAAGFGDCRFRRLALGSVLLVTARKGGVLA